jgi:hypothetical protein
MPQLQEDTEDFILQLDGVLPHFSFDLHAYFSANLLGRWSGHTSHKDSPLLWPPWSPDLTFCNFVLMSYIKGCLNVRPMPHDLPQLQQRIVEAVAAIGYQMLQHVWLELDYRIDICHVSKG